MANITFIIISSIVLSIFYSSLMVTENMRGNTEISHKTLAPHIQNLLLSISPPGVVHLLQHDTS